VSAAGRPHASQGAAEATQVTPAPTATPVLTISADHTFSGQARQLIAALVAELAATYPEEADGHFPFGEEEVAAGRGVFLVASSGGTAVGCGGLRTVEEGVGEIKRMFVQKDARGRGVARAVLAALEDAGRRLGLRRLILETGKRQGPALALYRRAGYVEIPLYGEFIGNPLSVCLAKDLAR
jgi:putative acetyltransferase